MASINETFTKCPGCNDRLLSIIRGVTCFLLTEHVSAQAAEKVATTAPNDQGVRSATVPAQGCQGSVTLTTS